MNGQAWAEVEELLHQHGIGLAGPELAGLMAGIAAAPCRDDGWIELIAPGAAPALRAALVRQRAELAAGMWRPDGGADGGRLAALRAELARRELDGFIVPRSDEHQGEYVALHAQRLAWLTGFTGSAGVAVVLRDRAAIFVDGRYTLQVAVEVDTVAFAPLHLVEQPPHKWLAEILAAGTRLGFDPWLHTAEGVERLRAACSRAGATLVACADNPLDAVWRDRPAPPIAPVVAHPLECAGMTAAVKRAGIAAALAADKLDAVVLSAPDSIAWLFNVRGGDVAFTPLPLSFAVIAADGSAQWLIDRRKLVAGLEQHLGDATTVLPPTALPDVLDRLGGERRRVRVDAATAAFWLVDRLETAGAVVDKGADPCALPNARPPGRGGGGGGPPPPAPRAPPPPRAWLARRGPGVGEIEAAERLEAFRRDNEMFRDLSFPTISGAGPNGAIVHYRSSAKTDRPLEEGMLYLVDSGAQYLDGTTDVTRTIAIGRPPPEARRCFTLVLKGHIALASVRFPVGTTGSQLDVLARRFLWQYGLDYDHGTGHGVGSFLSVHEGPQRISKPGNVVALQPGMILSNEPGYYKGGAFGIRIENLVVVTPSPVPAGERDMLAFETLTLAPIDLALVEPTLLGAEEAAWLDAYHARVRDSLGPLLDADTAAWLARATRAIQPA